MDLTESGQFDVNKIESVEGVAAMWTMSDGVVLPCETFWATKFCLFGICNWVINDINIWNISLRWTYPQKFLPSIKFPVNLMPCHET